MDGTFRLESRQLSPEQEAEELVRFLKEDPKWKRLDFYFSTHIKGHLISKAKCQAIDSPKKRTNSI